MRNSDKNISVVFVQRFMLHYRIDLFERINTDNRIEFKLLYGKGFNKTKFINHQGPVSFRHKQLKTIQYHNEAKAQYLVFFPSLFCQLRKLKAEVVVVEGESNMLNNLQVYLYSLFYGTKIIWWGLGLIPGYQLSFYQKLYQPAMKKILKRSSRIIGYSEYSKSYYSNFINPDKVLVANNCLDNESIDDEILKYREESLRLKKELGLQNKFVIIFVGALIKRKKVDRLIKAYHDNKATHPDSALIIVGEGLLKSELKSLVEEKNISDVIFTGRVVEDVSKYFLMADLFVLPGLGGLSIHHAMVHGLPVISASADGTERDLIVNNKNGYILESDSVEELALFLKKFLDHRELAKEFGKQSREIVEQKVNISNKVNIFLTAILDSVQK